MSAIATPAGQQQAPEVRSAAEGYAFCRAVAHKHGANFSVGFRFLPEIKRNAVYAAYAACRWADDIADDPGENIGPRLDAWQGELEACYAGRPTHAITIALADALEHFAIPKVEGFFALIDGCRQDMVKTRYETFDELLHYCDLVATSISEISLAIFGYKTPKAHEYGRNLSTALQLTNITRDIGDDLRRDRIYIPMEELDRFGVTEADLFAKTHSAGTRALVEFEARRALDYFGKAMPLLDELERDSRFPTLMMGSIYSEVLRRVLADPFATLHRRVSLSLPHKLFVVLRGLARPRFA
ncbi:MAG: squalene/phytoene synthase family protein [Acidobacteria bacterium]|nr:squalene/phytoene synthase family protein [Acidobacteriota bacterium]